MNRTIYFKIIAVVFFVVYDLNAIAQEASWVWVHGDSAYNKLPVRKTFGTPHPDNNPGSRYFATHWTDRNGNFWLYGGSVWYGTGARYGDLWCYYPDRNQWAWIWGDSTINRVMSYGTKNLPDAGNDPGGRFWSAGCVDDKDHLWLYGGWGIDSNYTYPQNDLWEYDIASNIWTWRGGTKTHPNNAPAKATQKYLPDTGFLPRPVWMGNIFTFEQDEHIYVFGGKSQNDTVNNHLFSYNTTSGEWTWISGVLSGNDAGSYGIKKQFSFNNTPSARANIASGVYDDQFFVFGGGNASNQSSTLHNDIWCYDKNTQQWKWLNGAAYPNGTGYFSGPCIQDSLSLPDARVMAYCADAGDIDSCGNLYVFGGNKTDHTAVLNDVWVYNIPSDVWTLLKPEKPLINKAVFRTFNQPDIDNNPGSIMGYASWIGKDGYLYVFGGLCHTPQTVVYNTMWKLVPDTSCWTSCYKRTAPLPPDTTGDASFFLPDAFTPNNDGRNDVLKLHGKNINLKVFAIYNRWGQEVFRTSNINNGWDGSFHGAPQPVGTYFYHIRYTDNKGSDQLRSGDVTLLR